MLQQQHRWPRAAADGLRVITCRLQRVLLCCNHWLSRINELKEVVHWHTRVHVLYHLTQYVVKLCGWLLLLIEALLLQGSMSTLSVLQQ